MARRATSPKSAIIAASHTQELADRWGRKVRNLILDHGPLLDLLAACEYNGFPATGKRARRTVPVSPSVI